MTVIEAGAGEDRKRAPKKDWKKIVLERITPILNTFASKGVLTNLRKMFYNLFAKGVIGNTKSDYNSLSEQTKNARMNGIIPIDCFVDEVRDTFDINGYKDDREFESVDDYIDFAINYLRNVPDEYVESLPKWYKQKNYVEDWIEKGALYRPFVGYLGDIRQVRIALDRGYDSLGNMVVNVRRLRRVAREEPDKEIWIKYFGDLDPSGDDMDRDLLKRIESISAKLNVDEFLNARFQSGQTAEEVLAHYAEGDPRLADLDELLNAATREDDYKDSAGKMVYGRNTLLDKIRIRKSMIIGHYHSERFPHLVIVTKEQEQAGDIPAIGRPKIIHFERVAVTEDQILRYNLPEQPSDQNTLDKLKHDTRYESHVEKYGRLIAVEVDALDALYPAVLEEFVRKTVDDYYDPEIYKREIVEKYGSKKYKKGINKEVIKKLKALIKELEKRKEKDFKDTVL
jgi:hypothetical protein